jgi:hypothetical protein
MRNTSFDSERGFVEDPSRVGTDPASAGARSDAPILAETRNLIRGVAARTRKNSVREMWDWARCKRVILPSVVELGELMAALDSSDRIYEDEDAAAESPIFLLATGWRSGSTLLQRILVTDPRVLLWGEPLGEMALVSGIAGMLTRLCTFPKLKERCAADATIFSSMATSWIATLYPPGNDLRVGLQNLLSRWLGEPARQRGFRRWGFKEVRLGGAEATLLHWLYPRAKFVLLCRNPYDCYRSLSDSGWHHVYHTRPDIRVDSAAGLARHWNRLALSWSELPANFPAFRIKYEDLIGGRVDFRELESWLGVKLNEDIALSAVVGRTARRHRLGLCERWIISHEAYAGMRALGYSYRA